MPNWSRCSTLDTCCSRRHFELRCSYNGNLVYQYQLCMAQLRHQPIQPVADEILERVL